VDGLGVKVLERLCDSILHQISGSEMETSIEMSQVQKWAKPTKSYRSQILTPALHFNQKKVRVQYSLQSKLHYECTMLWASVGYEMNCTLTVRK
jgi:ethanolamine utilization protein EutQ (cupin superfamily)